LTAYQAVDRWAGDPRSERSATDTATMESEPVITELADISVAVVGYHEPDQGPAEHGLADNRPADRVDIIDRRRLVEVASLTRADAVRLADRLCDAASCNDQPVMAKLIRDAAVEAIEDAAAALQGHDVRAAADFDLLVAEIAVAALNTAAARLRELGADSDSAKLRPPATPPSPIKE
jgi:hypothetical protein